MPCCLSSQTHLPPHASSVTRCPLSHTASQDPSSIRLCSQTWPAHRAARDLGIHEHEPRRQRCLHQQHSGRGGSCRMAGPQGAQRPACSTASCHRHTSCSRGSRSLSTACTLLGQPAAPPRQVIQGAQAAWHASCSGRAAVEAAGWLLGGGGAAAGRRRWRRSSRGAPDLSSPACIPETASHLTRNAASPVQGKAPQSADMAFQGMLRDVDGHGGKVGV